MKTKGKRKSRRNASEFPNLEKEFTLRRRLEFLDTDYVKGVTNKHGELVMRKLTYEEKAWLNQYYKETLNTSFEEDGSFYPIDGADKLSSKDIKTIRNHFISNDKAKVIVDELLSDKKLINDLSIKYNIPEETVINLVRRKEIYDANNKLNSDCYKANMQSTCEIVYDDKVEDFFHPFETCTESFEDAANDYLDFKERKDKGWDIYDDD